MYSPGDFSRFKRYQMIKQIHSQVSRRARIGELDDLLNPGGSDRKARYRDELIDFGNQHYLPNYQTVLPSSLIALKTDTALTDTALAAGSAQSMKSQIQEASFSPVTYLSPGSGSSPSLSSSSYQSGSIDSLTGLRANSTLVGRSRSAVRARKRVRASSLYSTQYGYGLVNAAAAVSAATGKTIPKVAALGDESWGLDQINAPEAWAKGYTGQGVVVAVVDSGVDYTHPDLKDNIWTNSGEIPGNGIDDDHDGYVDDVHGWDFVTGSSTPLDADSHGTHVAGIIAAENNGTGITGVAPNAKIMPVRVLDADGNGDLSTVAKGIRYAADKGANVINLSLGGQFSSPELTSAVQYAESRGAVVVMAAGNSGGAVPDSPARSAQQQGIAVGAVNRSKQLASFSNRAGRTRLNYVVAPGVNVTSTIPNDSYASYSGTSMATPYVSGVAALVLSANPNLTPHQVETLVTGSANPTGIIA
jgi:subtilisin family serine protease